MSKQPEQASESDERGGERWGSRIGVIFAVMGSAIGLGNFLRFPGQVAEYGGGHFMIPYVIAFLLLGLPIAWAEWSMGRFGGRKGFNSSPGIFYALWKNRSSPYMGVLGLMVPLGIYMYYVYIESWCLYYAFQYLADGIPRGRDPELFVGFFEDHVGMDAHGSLFQGGYFGLSAAVWLVILCFVINFSIIYRGLNRGIELVSRYAIPVLFLCAFGVLIRVLTLGAPDPARPELNVMNGLGYMWNPGRNGVAILENLANAEVWLAAAGQIFFSLSVGFGIIITYASYIKKDEDVLLSGTTSASGNVFAEVALGGMITVPAAFMFLGAAYLDDPSNVGTFSLGFMALPNVFANMPLGNVAGFVFFALLFLAALTSSLSMLQPVIAFLEEGLGLDRKASVALLAFISAVGTGFIVFFSEGLRALDMIDFWVGNVFIYILATLIVILFGWVIGIEDGFKEARRGSLLNIPQFFGFILKYVSPLYLIIIFAVWMYQKAGGYYEFFLEYDAARYSVFFLLFLLGFLLTLIAAAVRRWNRQRALESGADVGAGSGEGAGATDAGNDRRGAAK